MQVLVDEKASSGHDQLACITDSADPLDEIYTAHASGLEGALHTHFRPQDFSAADVPLDLADSLLGLGRGIQDLIVSTNKEADARASELRRAKALGRELDRAHNAQKDDAFRKDLANKAEAAAAARAKSKAKAKARTGASKGEG